MVISQVTPTLKISASVWAMGTRKHRRGRSGVYPRRGTGSQNWESSTGQGTPLRSGRRRPANKSMIGGILGEGSGFVLPASQIPLSAISPSKSGLNPQTETKGPRCIFAVVCHLGLLFNHNRLLGANGSD